MNTNQITRSKESNLSATVKGQKNTDNSNAYSETVGKSKSLEGKNNSYSNSHECSGGICSTTWKPSLPHIV